VNLAFDQDVRLLAWRLFGIVALLWPRSDCTSDAYTVASGRGNRIRMALGAERKSGAAFVSAGVAARFWRGYCWTTAGWGRVD